MLSADADRNEGKGFARGVPLRRQSRRAGGGAQRPGPSPGQPGSLRSPPWAGTRIRGCHGSGRAKPTPTATTVVPRLGAQRRQNLSTTSEPLSEDERMTEQWALDEVAHAGPEHLDPGYVATYDQKAGTDPVDDLTALRQHGLDDGSTVVDLGAGTGRFAVVAAPHCGRLVAVDVSPAMLDLLRTRATQAGLMNVSCVEAGFLSYQHDEPPADFVYTRNALHHLPDFWKAVALQRIAEMLRPHGVLRLRDLIFDFQPSQADAFVGRWLAHAAADPTRGYTRDDLAEHIRTEHSTFRWLLEPMLTAAGFEIVDAEFDRSVYGRYTCIRR